MIFSNINYNDNTDVSNIDDFQDTNVLESLILSMIESEKEFGKILNESVELESAQYVLEGADFKESIKKFLHKLKLAISRLYINYIESLRSILNLITVALMPTKKFVDKYESKLKGLKEKEFRSGILFSNSIEYDLDKIDLFKIYNQCENFLKKEVGEYSDILNNSDMGKDINDNYNSLKFRDKLNKYLIKEILNSSDEKLDNKSLKIAIRGECSTKEARNLFENTYSVDQILDFLKKSDDIIKSIKGDIIEVKKISNNTIKDIEKLEEQVSKEDKINIKALKNMANAYQVLSSTIVIVGKEKLSLAKEMTKSAKKAALYLIQIGRIRDYKLSDEIVKAYGSLGGFRWNVEE